MKHATSLLTALLTALLIASPALLHSQVDPEKDGTLPVTAGKNAEGTTFVVGFMQNEENTSICSLLGERSRPFHRISIASRFETRVTVTFPDGGSQSQLVDPFAIWSIELEGERFECLGEGICEKSIRIEADEPVSVYCFSSKGFTSDGYLALPVDSWGTEYFTANFPIDFYNARGGPDDECLLEPRGGEFAVIANEDSTVVDVSLNAPSISGLPAGQTSRRILMRGDIWQIQADGFTRGSSDLSGSRIQSNKPVGVLSGHVRTGIPLGLNTKDHLIEQLPPVSEYGRRHIVVPFAGRNGGDIVRVISTGSGTTDLTIEDIDGRFQLPMPGPGGVHQFLVSSPTVIESDAPVLVGHYSQSNPVDLDNNFDPYLIVVTPEEQFSSSAVFQTMPNISPVDTSLQFDNHFVTLVSEVQGYETIRLNNQLIEGHPLRVAEGSIPGLENEYRYVTLRLPQNRAFVIQGEAQFGGYVYGIGQWDSYGWPVGSGEFAEVVDSIPPVLSAEPDCGKLYYDIVATDSTREDFGLENVYLDASQSENVEIISSDNWVPNELKRVYRMRVGLVDNSMPGVAVVIAEDAAGNTSGEPGNRDTIIVHLELNRPEFSRDSVLIQKALRGQSVTELVRILNPHDSATFVIDSAKLVRGDVFSIDGLSTDGSIGIPLGPGQDYLISTTFLSDVEDRYDDTLIVWIDCLPYKIPLTALMSIPLIDIGDLDFGTIRRGTLKCLEICVSNPGEAPLELFGVKINGRYFSFEESSLPETPMTIPPGADTCFEICFEPTELGEFDGRVELESNAESGDSVGTLTGRSVYPDIDMSGYDFGAIQLGDTACARIPIWNNGSDTAYLTGLTIGKDVFVQDSAVFPTKLAPGDTLWVKVCFVPTETDPEDVFVGADNEDGLEATDRLKGSAFTLLAEIDGYDWGRRWVGSQHDTIVNVRNLTDREIDIDSVWVDGGDRGDFAILTPIPPSITLGPDEEYPIEVRFAPLEVGDRQIGIYASTTSRVQPIIQNMLLGFGVQVIPGAELIHDSSMIYSCDTRISRVLIYNRGNAPLTIESIWMENPDGVATLNGPGSNAQIPVGDTPLEAEVFFDFDSWVGTSTATVFWTFKEIPDDTFDMSMSVESAPQTYSIAASTPSQSVDNGDQFELFVAVDSSRWENIAHSEVQLTVSFNPTVSYFDRERFEGLLATQSGEWIFAGAAERPAKGTVILTLMTADGVPRIITGTTFPAIPFRGFLGNAVADTFDVTMQAMLPECVLLAETSHPYSIENICGLNQRLFVLAGEEPSLSQGKPNPASSTVDITYTIPFEAPVLLEVYGADGARVATFVDGTRPGGTHDETFDVSELSSGIYYYRFQYGSFTQTRKLVIQR